MKNLPEQLTPKLLEEYRHRDLVQCSGFEITVWVQNGAVTFYFAELERGRDQKGVAL